MTASLILMAAVASVKLVPDGMLGQSGHKGAFVEWTGCRSCEEDADGNVFLSGGWMVPASGGPVEKAERGAKAASAQGRPVGFAAMASRFSIDQKKHEVVGWDADGKCVGKVFSYGDRVERPDLVKAVAVHPETGDLLLGAYWPECRVHRFRPDGTEVLSPVWPFKAMAEDFSLAGGRMFALGERAYELSDKFGALSFGVNSGRVYDVARGKGGWWLATSQGAQFYTDAAAQSGRPAARRVGGLSGVTAVGISGGRVIVAEGYRVHSIWLDDRPDEPFTSSHNWCSIGKWKGAIDSVATAGDGAFFLHWSDGKDEAAWRFDPRITEWKDRKKRFHEVEAGRAMRRPANEADVGGCVRAVAEKGEIVLYRGSRRVGSRVVAATAIAAEGGWLVAYVPAIRGLVRFRVEMVLK